MLEKFVVMDSGAGGRPQEESLYVGGLPFSSTPQAVEDLFSRVGKLSRCSLKQGYAFIAYENPEHMQQAIDQFHDTEFEGRRIRVERSRPEQNRSNAECFNCHKVGHLSRQCPDRREDDLYVARRAVFGRWTPPWWSRRCAKPCKDSWCRWMGVDVCFGM